MVLFFLETILRLNVFQPTPVTLQDPFVLDHNITQNVSERMKIQIAQEMNVAAAKASKWPDNPQTKSFMDVINDDIPEGLDLKEVIVAVRKDKPKAKKKKGQAVDLELGDFQFAIEMKTELYNAQFLAKLGDAPDRFVAWAQHTALFIHMLMERVLMFDCEVASHNLTTAPIKSRQYFIRRKPQMKRTTSGSGDGSGASKKQKTESGFNTSGENAGESTVPGPSGATEMQGDAANKPSEYDTSEFQDSEAYIDMDVQVFCRTWGQRKKFTQFFKNQGYVDGVGLEQAISENLYYEHIGREHLAIVISQVVITSVRQGTTGYVLVDFKGDRRQKELFAISKYVKKFVENMTKSYLHQLS